MCKIEGLEVRNKSGIKTIPITEAVGMVLAYDITEIRQGEFKGRAFKKGHIIREEDISHLQRLGKENLFVINMAEDEMHEDEAAYALANALMGEGLKIEGEPREGKINIIADRDGLLRIHRDALLKFNMLGDVMCATLHTNTVVKKGQVVASTRAIPLIVKKQTVERAVEIANSVKWPVSSVNHRETENSPIHQVTHSPIHRITESPTGVIEVKELKKPKAGVVITGNEVYYGRIKDAFAPIITKKIEAFGGEIVGLYYAPDDVEFIEARLRELLQIGADLLITTGGMSVDPDDVTRFAIKRLGASDITYGSAVLPGAMFLVAYISATLRQSDSATNNSSAFSLQPIPILGIPACGMYHKITVFDLILPRILAGEKIGRFELAELGHGGLCLNCKKCKYPVCPFGK